MTWGDGISGFLINAGARPRAAGTGVTHPPQPVSPALDLPAAGHPVPRLPAAGLLARAQRAQDLAPPRRWAALARPPWTAGLSMWCRRAPARPARAWRPWRQDPARRAGPGWGWCRA